MYVGAVVEVWPGGYSGTPRASQIPCTFRRAVTLPPTGRTGDPRLLHSALAVSGSESKKPHVIADRKAFGFFRSRRWLPLGTGRVMIDGNKL